MKHTNGKMNIHLCEAYFNQTGEGHVMLDFDLKLIFINEPAASVLKSGFGIKLKAGDDFITKLPEQQKAEIVEALNETKGGIARYYEMPYTSKGDSGTQWLGIRAIPIRDEENTIISVSLSINDITTEKKAELVLKNSSNRLKQSLHDLGDHAWSHDFKTGITWFSTDTNPFLGYKKGELVPEQMETIWWESTLPEFRHLLEESDQAYRSGKQTRHALEYKIKDKKGKVRWVLDRGVVTQTTPNGMPLEIVGTHVDITLLKEYQHQLAEMERQKKREVVDAVILNLEADRKQLATELRDNINQTLTAAKMMMEFLPVINKEVTQYTGKVNEIIYAAVDEVNKICNTINPDSLDHVALPDLVKDMVSILNREKHIRIDLDMTCWDSRKKKDRNHELTIFRVIQDIMHRITHESKSNQVSLQLDSSSANMHLHIGCDDPTLDLAKLGRDLYVKNLINRCEHFGGYLLMEKTKGEGVQFTVGMPLH